MRRMNSSNPASLDEELGVRPLKESTPEPIVRLRSR